MPRAAQLAEAEFFMTWTSSLAIVWVVVACVLAGLALYRKLVARSEDDMLHVRESEQPLVRRQAFVAGRLDLVDKWGKTLTVILVVSGLLIGALYLYQQWVASNQPFNGL
jgi:hypothetical protein